MPKVSGEKNLPEPIECRYELLWAWGERYPDERVLRFLGAKDITSYEPRFFNPNNRYRASFVSPRPITKEQIKKAGETVQFEVFCIREDMHKLEKRVYELENRRWWHFWR